MNHFTRKFLLTLIAAVLSACVTTQPQQVWIDVRSDDEYQQEHLTGAINIEYTEILQGVVEAGLDKDTEILLYCGSGRRAGIALEALQQAGFTKIVNRGGIAELLEQQSN